MSDFLLVLLYASLARLFDGLMDDWRDRFWVGSRLFRYIVPRLGEWEHNNIASSIYLFLAGTRERGTPYRLFGVLAFDYWHCLKYLREFFICAMISPFLGWWAVLVIYSLGAAVFVIVYHGLEKR